MRRTASEVLSELELRVARLESQIRTASFDDDEDEEESVFDLFEEVVQEMVSDRSQLEWGDYEAGDSERESITYYDTRRSNYSKEIRCSLFNVGDGKWELECEFSGGRKDYFKGYPFSVARLSDTAFRQQIHTLAQKFLKEEVH